MLYALSVLSFLRLDPRKKPPPASPVLPTALPLPPQPAKPVAAEMKILSRRDPRRRGTEPLPVEAPPPSLSASPLRPLPSHGSLLPTDPSRLQPDTIAAAPVVRQAWLQTDLRGFCVPILGAYHLGDKCELTKAGAKSLLVMYGRIVGGFVR